MLKSLLIDIIRPENGESLGQNLQNFLDDSCGSVTSKGTTGLTNCGDHSHAQEWMMKEYPNYWSIPSLSFLAKCKLRAFDKDVTN